MAKLFGIAVGMIVAAIFALFLGRVRETSKVKQLVAALAHWGSRSAKRVNFASLHVPLPVARYFRHVLTDGQAVIKTARLKQSGVLRTHTKSREWFPFTATQVVVPAVTGFLWDAKVRMPFATHVRVLDSYIAGVGSGRVSLMSAVAVASEAGAPELNSGALQRYLAEGVWFPTALLPECGVLWSPVNDHSAMATLQDSAGATVSVEFRFNEIGEVTGIYSAGRFRRTDRGYELVPWEGHFGLYQTKSGMRIPQYGEVGWYEDGAFQLVWKGNITHAEYEMTAQ